MNFIADWIANNIQHFGYTAIVVLMALESANIPIPSEVTLPFAGYLVSQGQLNLHLASFAGAFGCLLGSVFSYWLGYRFGREFAERWGKWFFIHKSDLERGDRWMGKYGNSIAFFSRLLPVVRTFISFVAGIWKAPFWLFAVLSFLGSWIWSYVLVIVGDQLGQHWVVIHEVGKKFDVAIVLVIICVAGYFIRREYCKRTCKAA